MDKILVSACLLGDRVRYDAADNSLHSGRLQQWQEEGRLIPICPEVSGGLPVPRPPAEIQSGSGDDVMSGHARILNINGQDVSHAFVLGAERALAVAQAHDCRYAILAARSPSCGIDEIYDGTFSGQLVSGDGTTAALLKANDIRVFTQKQIEELADLLAAEAT